MLRIKEISAGVLSFGVLSLPLFAFAQFGPVNSFFTDINQFINYVLIPLVISLALLVFIWGVFKYFIAGGADSTKREEGKQLIMYSIIGFVLIVSIWGIVNLLASGLFGGDNRPPDPPRF